MIDDKAKPWNKCVAPIVMAHKSDERGCGWMTGKLVGFGRQERRKRGRNKGKVGEGVCVT
jgi:hypothetical protein